MDHWHGTWVSTSVGISVNAMPRYFGNHMESDMTQGMRNLLLALLLGSSGLLAACNTVDGAGKDIERGGEKVQDAAKPGDQR